MSLFELRLRVRVRRDYMMEGKRKVTTTSTSTMLTKINFS